MNTTFVLAAIPLGLVLGGFATVLVDRIPDKTPLGWSRCPQCSERLSLLDQIPVVSWLLRRGRCRHCDDSITVGYPVVEVLTAGLVVAVAARFGWEWSVVPPLILVVALVALSTIDVYVYRLPDRLVFPSLLISVVAMVAIAIGTDQADVIPKALVGAAGYFLILFVAHVISPRGMGFGDVKLAMLLGLHVGWVAATGWSGWSPVFRLVFWALMLGCIIGVVLGVLVAIVRRATGRDLVADPDATDGQPTALRKQSFPFGPGLAAGTMVVVLFAETLLG